MIDSLPGISASAALLQRDLRQAFNKVKALPILVEWQFERYATDHFPLQLYASARIGGDPDPVRELVLSIQIHRPDGANGKELVLSGDVAWEGDVVLAESPRIVVSLEEPAASTKLHNSSVALGHWLRDQIPLISAQLMQRLQPEAQTR